MDKIEIEYNGALAVCKINGKDILHAYGESLKLWATAFVDELEKEEQSK